MDTNGINIGITIGLSTKQPSIWINGISMNAIFLADALMQSNKNYNVYLLNTSSVRIKLNDPDVKIPWDTNKYPIYEYHEMAEKTDLLIQLSTSFPKKSNDEFKGLNINKLPKKIVGYKCGNNYVIEMQRALYCSMEDDPKYVAAWSGNTDDIWFVPQQEYHNKHYYDVFENVNSKPVPFVWNSIFLDEFEKDYNEQLNSTVYYEHTDKKRIVCFEPNNDVLKYNMIPTLITELAYRKRKDNVDNYVVCSGKTIGIKQSYITHVTKLDIFKDGLLKVDGRWPMPKYLSENTDIVVSHQWDNPLNYAYLDAIYFDYPLIHNAYMVQDAGYYYEDFNIPEGSKQLINAIDNHSNNIDEYKSKSSLVLSRYTASKNKGIIETYDKLIENLWNKDKHKLSYKYDWKTNLYK